MKIEDCYEKMGANFGEVCSRLPSVSLVERFLGKFLEDKSYETLCSQLECKNREEAFRAAHTLKGVCANLAFTKLFDSVSPLTEALRPEDAAVSDTVLSLFGNVTKDYELTVNAIREYLSDKE
ncbi:MAG: Hpt domain-containing protein [Clostridia bacterium]|nr:Hpt domain-containing protein [Clostridia bacterium]